MTKAKVLEKATETKADKQTEKTVKKVEKPTKQEKEIKLEFVKMCQERNALHKREERAREYCEQVQRRRNKRITKICKTIETVAIVLTFVIVAFVIIKGRVAAETQGNTYTIQGELQGNHVVLSDGNVHEVDKANANYSSEPKQVTVTLNDNGTEDVDDDIILNIQ